MHQMLEKDLKKKKGKRVVFGNGVSTCLGCFEGWFAAAPNSRGSYVRAHLLSVHLFCRQQFPVRIKPGEHQREETNHGGLKARCTPPGLQCCKLSLSSSRRLLRVEHFKLINRIYRLLKKWTWRRGSPRLSKLSRRLKNHNSPWPSLGDVVTQLLHVIYISTLWHAQVPAPLQKKKPQAFFFSLRVFVVTLVRLRLWRKPSLSCQNSWCALSQTIYWCWV